MAVKLSCFLKGKKDKNAYFTSKSSVLKAGKKTGFSVFSVGFFLHV